MTVNSTPPATDADGSPILSFNHVALTFDTGVNALRDVDLEVKRGEFVSILGPSGCGKSTLLRIASGLVDYTAGELRVDRSHIAFTFQDATLLPWRTVRRNVELLLELRRVGSAERRRVAEEKITLVGLNGFEDHYPRHLSGGMKMRVSLARAMTVDPALFLFDEPFGALDEISRERLNEEVQSLYRQHGFTALFVTHSVSEAVFMSSRVVVMSARPGRIVGTFDIPLPFPRDASMRFSPIFAEQCGILSAALRATERSEE